MRAVRVAALVAACVTAPIFAVAQTEISPQRGVPGTRQQLFEGWLASDAAVLGTYSGVDSALGARYHRVDVESVWSGSPSAGPLVFKAPRGIRARPGDRVLLLLWDRLAGAPDSYLEEAKSRYGEGTWEAIGHDSLAAYLLPFPSYSYPADGERLVLRGRNPLPTKIDLAALGRDVAGWERDHTPASLYARSDVVVRARVTAAALQPRTQHGIVVEWRVHSAFGLQDTYKGTPPDSLALEFPSFPRAPRFRAGDEVILFLSRADDGRLFLAVGKRGVLHVERGEVLEAGKPLPEFVKQMRGA